jgi:cytochrome P450
VTETKTDFRYDPFSVEAMRDPQSFYETLREEHPAYFMPQYDGYAISRFEDNWKAYMNSSDFTESEGQIFSREQMLVHHRNDPPLPSFEPMVPMFNFVDPPFHSHFRRVMAPPFSKSSINKLEERLTELVRARLKELIGRGSFDLNVDLGSHISSAASAIVAGVPVEDAPKITALVTRMTARDPEASGETSDGNVARDEMMAYLADLVAQRRAGDGHPSQLIDLLIGADIVGRPLSDMEIAVDLLSILFGGTETVPKVLAGGLLELSKRPDQLRAVREDLASNVPPLVEEMFRYCAPAQWFGRTAKNPVEVAGVTVEPGQRVFLLIAAANRDRREYDDPDAFIWNRPIRRLLSFGIGPHFCIGIHLARLEERIMMRELLSTIDRFEIDPAAGEWASSEFQVGWLKLPLHVR